MPPYVILDRELTDGAGQKHPIRIGVIGFAPPQIMVWDRKHLEGSAETRDIVEAAAGLGAEDAGGRRRLVVALAIPASAAEHVRRQENAAILLAGVEGIDVMLTGHQHLVFPGADLRRHRGRRRGCRHADGQARA